MITSYTQYIWLDETGVPVQYCNQSANYDPVVGDDLKCLIINAAGWADLAKDNFLAALDDENSLFARYTIAREQIEIHELTPEEHATLQRLKTEH